MSNPYIALETTSGKRCSIKADQVTALIDGDEENQTKVMLANGTYLFVEGDISQVEQSCISGLYGLQEIINY